MVLCGFVVVHRVEPQAGLGLSHVAGVSDETIVWTSPIIDVITPVENWSR